MTGCSGCPDCRTHHGMYKSAIVCQERLNRTSLQHGSSMGCPGERTIGFFFWVPSRYLMFAQQLGFCTIPCSEDPCCVTDVIAQARQKSEARSQHEPNMFQNFPSRGEIIIIRCTWSCNSLCLAIKIQ